MNEMEQASAGRASAGLADLLQELLEGHRDEGVRVEALVKAVGERGFGLPLIVASLPLLIPMPPGTSLLLGMVILAVALQAFVGRDTVWLPRRCMAWRLSPKAIDFLISRALPMLRRVERWGKRRARGSVSTRRLRWVSCAAAAMGLIMATPIPFLNTVPALVTLALGVGLVKEDTRLLNVAVAVTGILFLAVVGGVSVLILNFGSFDSLEEIGAFLRISGADFLPLGG